MVTPTNPDWVTDPMRGLTASIQTYGGNDPYSLVAPLSANQNQAIDRAHNLGGWQDTLASAGGMAGQAANAPAHTAAPAYAQTQIAGVPDGWTPREAPATLFGGTPAPSAEQSLSSHYGGATLGPVEQMRAAVFGGANAGTAAQAQSALTAAPRLGNAAQAGTSLFGGVNAGPAAQAQTSTFNGAPLGPAQAAQLQQAYTAPNPGPAAQAGLAGYIAPDPGAAAQAQGFGFGGAQAGPARQASMFNADAASPGPAARMTAATTGPAAQASARGYDPALLGTAQGYNPSTYQAPALGNAAQMIAEGYTPAQAQAAGLGPVAQAQAAQAGNVSLLDGGLEHYLNPATQSLVDATMASFDDQAGRQQAAYQAQGARSGAFGGSRFGVGEAQLAADQGRNRALADAQLRSNAFNAATGLATTDAGFRQSSNQFNAGQTETANLANAAAQNAFTSQQSAQQQAANLANAGFTNEANASQANARNQAEWGPKASIDFEEFASYYPVAVTTRMIGAPLDAIPALRSSMEALGAAFSMDRAMLPALNEAMGMLDRFVGHLVSERRANPHTREERDLLDLLLETGGDDGITERQLADLLIFLFVAGYDTSKNVLTCMMQLMIRHPDIYERCAVDHDYCQKVVEETMRMFTPSSTFRATTQDIVYRDVLIPKGTMLFFSLNIAGRLSRDVEDPHLFEPDRIVPARLRQVGFGLGKHMCLGQYIARAQLQEGIHLIARHMRDPRQTAEPGWRPYPGVWGIKGLPIAFTPN